jgi:hypothetical protein
MMFSLFVLIAAANVRFAFIHNSSSSTQVAAAG